MKHNVATRCAVLFLALALAFVSCAALAETVNTYDIIYSSDNPIPEIAKAVRPSVVQVTSSVEKWDSTTRKGSVEPEGYGSATYIRAADDGEGGYVLTNYHVVQDGDVFDLLWLDGTQMNATLVGYDDGSDIAVLRFKDAAPADAKPVPLGDSDALEIGELAICIGNPGSGSETLFGTVTAGIISGLQRESINANNFKHNVSVIQTDAPINSGNSGGALLNAKGELVGIPTLKMGVSYTTVFEGLGFCIPISFVKDYIEQIITKGNVTRPRMGVTVTTVDGPDEAMRRYPPIGAQVYSVEPGTPADRAGLQEKDIITEANGERIKSSSDLVAVIDQCNAGDSVQLKVYRYSYDADGNVTGDYQELDMTLQLELLD